MSSAQSSENVPLLLSPFFGTLPSVCLIKINYWKSLLDTTSSAKGDGPEVKGLGFFSWLLISSPCNFGQVTQSPHCFWVICQMKTYPPKQEWGTFTMYNVTYLFSISVLYLMLRAKSEVNRAGIILPFCSWGNTWDYVISEWWHLILFVFLTILNFCQGLHEPFSWPLRNTCSEHRRYIWLFKLESELFHIEIWLLVFFRTGSFKNYVLVISWAKWYLWLT